MNTSTPGKGLLFRRMSHLAVMTAMVTLTLSEASVLQPGVTVGAAALPLAYLAGVLGGGIASWYLAERPGRGVFSQRTSMMLVLGVALFVTAEYLLSQSGDWIVTLAHFLILVQLVKLFGRKARRDYWQMYLISLVHISVASVVTSDVVFAAGLLVYSGMMLWVLVLFHFRCQEETWGASAEVHNGSDGGGAASKVLSRRFAVTLTLVLAGLWVGNVLFFMLSPRLQRPLFNFAHTALGQTALTGFGNSMQLGEMGTILENHAPVMHVTLKRDGEPYREANEADLEWRGTTLQHYDGERYRWEEAGPEFNNRENAVLRSPAPLKGKNTAPGDVIVEESVLLQPTGEAVLFALPRAVWLEGVRLGDCSFRWVDDTFRTSRPPVQPVRYDITSVREGPSLKGGTILAATRRAYLQMPAELSERVRAYAREVAGGRATRTARGKAEAIEAELRSKFGYTLEMDTAEGKEPIDYFLFTRKKGHCEYFAAAMVMMLRSAGVPARVVTGFKGAEWNDIGQWYVVRQSDAHAWVEAWVDGEGWVSFDPTPPGDRISARGDSGFGWFARWKDYVYNKWVQNVFQYDRQQQVEVYRGAGAAVGRVRGLLARLAQWLSDAARWLREGIFDMMFLRSAYGMIAVAVTLVVSGFLGVGVYLGGKWALKRLGEKRRQKRWGGQGSTWFYVEMIKMLRKRGLRRSPEVTPAEFAELVRAQLSTEGAGAVRSITETFCRVRYGGGELDEETRREVKRELERLRGEMRRRRRDS